MVQLEVEFVLAAHRFYSDAVCLEGIDSLLEFTTLSVGRWIKQSEHKALVRLATGKSFALCLKILQVSACSISAVQASSVLSSFDSLLLLHRTHGQLICPE